MMAKTRSGALELDDSPLQTHRKAADDSNRCEPTTGDTTGNKRALSEAYRLLDSIADRHGLTVEEIGNDR